MNINLIGVPLFYGCDRPGVEFGPNALRDNELKTVLSVDGKHKIYDIGNLYVETVDEKDKYTNHSVMKYLSPITEVNTNLAHVVYNSLTSDCFPFTVGGDHSLGLGSVAGSARFHGDDFGVIWIDAHGDINTDTTSPSGNVHGMPLAASMGLGYKDLVDIYFEGRKVKPSNIFILGARDLDKGELDLIKELGLNVWTTKAIKDKGTDKVIREFYDALDSSKVNNFHLSFDIDCLDSSLVPGTGTPVSEGLSLDEVTSITKSVLLTKKVRSMDFVEFNPKLDIEDTTLKNCLKMLQVIAENL
ncbi:arginase [Clostridium sp. YIM B02505]|uniref:Arginase n=1 Tax=Clostridium yunnanense TaxID=2800325 RepID=A0ABS1EWB2_9CLOT|nr:arginase [Clostridium yunnanense]MBK1813667.1 arginase [Clostridium yunnanense]